MASPSPRGTGRISPVRSIAFVRDAAPLGKCGICYGPNYEEHDFCQTQGRSVARPSCWAGGDLASAAQLADPAFGASSNPNRPLGRPAGCKMTSHTPDGWRSVRYSGTRSWLAEGPMSFDRLSGAISSRFSAARRHTEGRSSADISFSTICARRCRREGRTASMQDRPLGRERCCSALHPAPTGRRPASRTRPRRLAWPQEAEGSRSLIEPERISERPPQLAALSFWLARPGGRPRWAAGQ
jgi:hypothetical protein